MIRFILLIALVACAETQVNVTDCPPENATELAAREASNAYQKDRLEYKLLHEQCLLELGGRLRNSRTGCLDCLDFGL